MPDHTDDLFEGFRAMSNTDLHPLPASEVRRRGDRRRRRTTALAVAGGALAAVAVVGVPLALATEGDDRTRDDSMVATDPSPAPVQWRTEVPEDFPITGGLPQDDPDRIDVRSDYLPQAVGPCASGAWDVGGALDVLSAVYTDPSEGGLDRVVSVFEDDDTAARRLDRLREEVETCEPQSQPRVSARLLVSDLGEQSVVFVNRYDDTGEGILHEAVRVGNAVLYSTSTFLGAGDPAVVEEMRELEQQRSAAAVTAMCVFAADPC